MEIALSIIALLVLLPLLPDIRVFMKNLMDDINGKPKQ